MVAAPLDVFARDTRVLVLFDEIYTGLSMTRAAEKLGLSQPTVSIWVGKLRRQLRDPLFVRMAHGLKPTPRADALIGPVRQALESLRRLAGETPAFDPSRERRTFRIAMTDASHVTLLPALLARVRALGPNLGLEVLPISAGTGRDLEEGRADLAIGTVDGLESGFHEQKLYDQDFVCLVGARHPRIGPDGMGARTYLQEAHVGILTGASYSSLRVSLATQHLKRRVMLELPGFMGLAAIVASTDLVATVPRHIGETLAQGSGVRVVRCPVKIAGFAVKQYWHERYHRDPGHQWLRSVSFELFAHGSPRRHARDRRGKVAAFSDN
jgi:DNA-binding transcriptional LysR family regulator